METAAAIPVVNPSTGQETTCKGLMGLCKQCLNIVCYSNQETSVQVLNSSRCPQCQNTLWMPEELLRFFSIFGHYLPQSVGACLLYTSMRIPAALMPHFISSFANSFTDGLQTEYAYDVVIPRGPKGLGMKIRNHGEDVVIGGFTPAENGIHGAAKSTQKMNAGDILVAVNKDTIRTLTFDQKVELMSRAASPLYLTFVRPSPLKML